MTEPAAPERPQGPFRDRPVSFVRRSGRMSEAQDRAWAELSDFYVIPVTRGDAATSVAPGSHIDVAATFGRDARLVVEIGSGQGHAIVHAAAQHPDTNFLAVEVFRAGLARTMLNAESAGLDHLRLVEANAPEVLLHLLPAQAATEVWVFFPDPWHKSKHNKRRLVTAEFAAIVRASVADGGCIRLATDWEDYALQMRDVFDTAPGWERGFTGEWAPRFDGRVLTAFENKGTRAGRDIRDLCYRRTPTR